MSFLNLNGLPEAYLRPSKAMDKNDFLNIWGSELTSFKKNSTLVKIDKNEVSKSFSEKSPDNLSTPLQCSEMSTDNEKEIESLFSSNNKESCNPYFAPNFIVGGAISTQSGLASLHSKMADTEYSDLKSVIEVPGEYPVSVIPLESSAGKLLECHTTPSLASVSSFASSKILEWDSGADVGYLKKGEDNPDFYLSALERMAIRNYALALISELNNQNLDAGLIKGGVPGSLLHLTYDQSCDFGLGSSPNAFSNLNLKEMHSEVDHKNEIEKVSLHKSLPDFLEPEDFQALPSISSSNTLLANSNTDVHNSTFDYENSSLDTESIRNTLTQCNTTGSTSDMLYTGSSCTNLTDSVNISSSLSNCCFKTDCHSQFKEMINHSDQERLTPFQESKKEILREIHPHDTRTKTYYFEYSEGNKEENKSPVLGKSDEKTESTKSAISSRSNDSRDESTLQEDVAPSFKSISSQENDQCLQGECITPSKTLKETLENEHSRSSKQDSGSSETKCSRDTNCNMQYAASSSEYSLIGDRTKKLKRKIQRKAKALEHLDSSESTTKLSICQLHKYIKSLEKLEKKLMPFLDESSKSEASSSSSIGMNSHLESHAEFQGLQQSRRRHLTYTKEPLHLAPEQSGNSITSSPENVYQESPPFSNDYHSKRTEYSSHEIVPDNSLPDNQECFQILKSDNLGWKKERHFDRTAVLNEKEVAIQANEFSKLNSNDTSNRESRLLEHMSSQDDANDSEYLFGFATELTKKIDNAFFQSNLTSKEDEPCKYGTNFDNETSNHHQTSSARVAGEYFGAPTLCKSPLLTSSRKHLSKDFTQMFPSCQDLMDREKEIKPLLRNQEAQTEENLSRISMINNSEKNSPIAPLSGSPFDSHTVQKKSNSGFVHDQNGGADLISGKKFVHSKINELRCAFEEKNQAPALYSEKLFPHNNVFQNIYVQSLPKSKYLSSESTVSIEVNSLKSSKTLSAHKNPNAYGNKFLDAELPRNEINCDALSKPCNEKENSPFDKNLSPSFLPDLNEKIMPSKRLTNKEIIKENHDLSNSFCKKGIKFTISIDPKVTSRETKILSQEPVEVNKKKETLTLREALFLAKPKFISLAEKRRAKICRKQTFRKLCQEQNHEVLAALPDNLRSASVLQKFLIKSSESPIFTYKSMRSQNKRLYRLLPESGFPAKCKLKDETKKINRRMAQLYSQRLRQKTLDGKVTLSHRYIITPLE